jgi:hypothetical protein
MNLDWKIPIYQRDNYQCKICGTRGSKENPLTVHHCVARACGGASNLDNCVIWCKCCHHKYHERHGLDVSDYKGNPIATSKLIFAGKKPFGRTFKKKHKKHRKRH